MDDDQGTRAYLGKISERGFEGGVPPCFPRAPSIRANAIALFDIPLGSDVGMRLNAPTQCSCSIMLPAIAPTTPPTVPLNRLGESGCMHD
jgi:hypothetical protein